MINCITVSNYKGIKSDIEIKFLSNQTFNVLFGGIHSEKSTIFESIYLFKMSFLYGMRFIDRIEDVTNFTVKLEFQLDHEVYNYETILNLEQNEVHFEKLTHKKKTTEEVLFVRNAYDITIGKSLEKRFTSFDFERFKTYLYDIRFDRKLFILSHLRTKDFSDSPKVNLLDKLSERIKNIHIFNEKSDIKFFLDMDDAHYLKVLEFLKSLKLNVKSLQYRQLSLDELRFNLNRHRYDYLLDEFRNYVTLNQTHSFFVECYGQFYKLKGKRVSDLTIQTVDVHFEDDTVIAFNELSTGYKDLMLLVMILLKPGQGNLVFIDNLTKNIDHLTIVEVIKKISTIFKTHHKRLVFSTYDMLLFDSAYFDLNELAIVSKKDSIKLDYLNNLKIRKDKKLLNYFLESTQK